MCNTIFPHVLDVAPGWTGLKSLHRKACRVAQPETQPEEARRTTEREKEFK